MSVYVRSRRYKVGSTVLPVIGGGTSTNLIYPPDVNMSVVVPLAKTQPAYLVPTIITDYGDTPDGYYRIFTRMLARHHYSKTNPFNCDDSRYLANSGLLCDGNGETTGVVYQSIRTLTGIGVNYEWDKTDKYKLYTINNGKLWSINSETNGKTVLHDFTDPNVAQNPYGYFTTITKGESAGNMDDECDYVPIGGTIITPTGTKRMMGYYRISTNLTVLKPFSFFYVPDYNVASTGPGDPGISCNYENTMFRNGQGLLLNNAGTQLKKLVDGITNDNTYQLVSYDLDLNFVKALGTGSHTDVCSDTDGNQINIHAGGLNDSMGYVDMVTGIKTSQMPNAYNSAFNNGQAMTGHCSGRNIDRPGWWYFSSSGYIPTSGLPSYRELFAIKADGNVQGSVTVNRFGFVMVDRPSAYITGGGSTYNIEPHGVVNRKGNKMTAQTCWPGASTVDSYTYEMVTIAEYNRRIAALSNP